MNADQITLGELVSQNPDAAPVLHRHRLYWDNPDAFQPSRFWPENRDAIDRFQYLPFGAGQRICIGATFALQEAVIALALLLNEFRFEATPGLNPWPIQKLTVQARNGLPPGTLPTPPEGQSTRTPGPIVAPLTS